MNERSTKIGHVVSVAGSRVSALLVYADAGAPDERSTSSMLGGDGSGTTRSAVQVGAIARIHTGHSTVFGMISSLRTENPSFPPGADEKNFFEMDLLGEAMMDVSSGAEGTFQRGVSVYPGLGAEIFTATRDDLERVYARPAASNVRLGAIHQDKTLPAFVTTDHLVGKHFAVLGTSGAGKSCTVALLLRAILDQNTSGHIVLLDPHNEYSQAFDTRAEIVSPQNMEMPYWLLNFEETVELLIGRGGMSEETEVGILKGGILDAKRRYFGEGRDTSYITVDTPVPYRMATLLQYLDKQMGRLDKPDTAAPYMRIKDRIETLTADSRYGFMFSGMFIADNMSKILSRILRIPVAGKPITIVDLSGVPSEIVEVLVSMVSRMIFDFALWSERSKAVPVLLVCEEAHRYVPKTESAFSSARQALARIAKEGRKYGVALCLITQRPSEIDPVVLSQCNTLFALRMSNFPDQEFVAKTLPDSAGGLINSLPALRTQEAIVVGEGVNVPVRLTMDDLPEEFRPRSGSAKFAAAWRAETTPQGFVEATVERWRRQQRD
ncbi:MAG: ATP-binding protein [Candidatus Binatia bacterium]